MNKTMTAAEFPFDEIRALVAEGRERRAGTLALRSLNTMLVAGQFAEVDKVLAVAPLDGITPTIAVIYLSIISHAKQHLAERPAFVERVRTWVAERVGAERAAAILHGLD